MTFTKKDISKYAANLNMSGRSKATKAEIVQWLTDRGVDIEATLAQGTDEVVYADKELDQPEPETYALAVISEPEEEVIEGELVEDDDEPFLTGEEQFSLIGTGEQLALMAAAEVAKEVAKRKKKTPDVYVFTKLEANDWAWIESNTTTTMHTCSDPNRKVVKRTKVAAYLSDKLNVHISHKVMNQLVAMSCSYIERRALTIKSASRFNYLLNENNEVAMVMDFVLAHPELISEARAKYEKASRQGAQSIATYYESN